MTLDSKPSNPDPPNNGPVINSEDQIKATENILEDYYDNFFDNNHPKFSMIWKTIK